MSDSPTINTQTLNVLTEGEVRAEYWSGSTSAKIAIFSKHLFDLQRKHLQAIHNVLGAVLAMMPAEPETVLMGDVKGSH